MRVRPLLAGLIIGAAMVSIPATAVAGMEYGRPEGVNPYLSFAPNQSDATNAAWRHYLAGRSAGRAMARAGEDPLVVRENEPAGVSGRNDSQRTAERVRGFGTAPGQHTSARILGQLSPQEADIDFYRVDLAAGDVFGALVNGEARDVGIFDPAGVLLMGSQVDFSVIFPAASPLPRGGNAMAEHVASVSGSHYLAVNSGAGAYEVTAVVHRPPLEREAAPQTVFLDFDGAEVDTRVWEGPGIRKLSPFSGFLANWGLSTSDEPALVRQIQQTVRENLYDDTRTLGNNPNVALVLRNSLEHPDTFGQNNVSRVVIGGTVEELGLGDTVGIAQSIDPGNFAHEETAVVLQDFLSEPAGSGVSLNTYLTPASNRIEFIGRAIGNVVAHEIGHYVGSWHTDPRNASANIMDAGGTGFDRFYGVGPDGIGGTADDTDNDLGSDAITVPFSGTMDTLNRTAFGLAGFRGQS